MPRTLAELRRAIDRVDEQVQELLAQRAELVEEIAAQKHAQGEHAVAMVNPAREAQVLRRIAERHRGRFPLGMTLRIWRLIISGVTALQLPVSVAVYAPSPRRGFWDVARDHFGPLVPMTAHVTAVNAIRAVCEGRSTFAVVPLPVGDDPAPWWPMLMSPDPKLPRVFARLPFFGRGNARAEEGEALAVGHVPFQDSGSDASLVALELGETASQDRLRRQLSAAGLDHARIVARTEPDPARPSAVLVELDGCLAQGDARLLDLARSLDPLGGRVLPLGGYPLPLAAEPAPAG